MPADAAAPSELRLARFETTALRVALGPVTLEVASVLLHEVVGGLQGLQSFTAARAELAGVKLGGTVSTSAAHAPATAGPWNLAPLAGAEGTVRAEIVDAHLLFDADVTVPVRQGQVEFREATVEHVGPDSRMGISRLGLYVDAPNGRSYLFQFSSAPVDGVEYEKRGALLGPWVTDRGRLRLQPFLESLLKQSARGPAFTFTDQARHLFERTAVSGEVQLGDGPFAGPGLQAEFTGRADRRNLVRVHSEAVGRGLTLEIPSLSVRDASVELGGMRLRASDVTGALTLRVFRDDGELRFVLELAKATLTGLQLRVGGAPGA